MRQLVVSFFLLPGGLAFVLLVAAPALRTSRTGHPESSESPTRKQVRLQPPLPSV